jgi:hypothetical protein
LEDNSKNILAKLHHLIPDEVLEESSKLNDKQRLQLEGDKNRNQVCKEDENSVLFDYISSIWAGRTAGALCRKQQGGKLQGS